MKQGKMLHSVQGALWKEVVREALSEEGHLSGALSGTGEWAPGHRGKSHQMKTWFWYVDEKEDGGPEEWGVSFSQLCQRNSQGLVL